MVRKNVSSRFAHPAALRGIARPLLVAFLSPYRDFLQSKGFYFSLGHTLNYDALSAILVTPAEDTPEDLLDAVFFIGETAVPEAYDALLAETRRAGIEIEDDRHSPADLAVRLWLVNPEALQRLHAERHLVRPKSFQGHLSAAWHLPEVGLPSAETLARLEAALNDWFETRKRGRGTRVFPFLRDDDLWFLVRHGETYRREGTLDNGRPGCVHYRPEKFDVLIYDGQVGELAIHAATKAERKAYCQFFGHYIFGHWDFFDEDGVFGQYTLTPIRTDGPACLACTDVGGLDRVQLVELHFRHPDDLTHTEVHRAEDVFGALACADRLIPPEARLLRATFRVTFTDDERPRSLVVCPPNKTTFDRESDSGILHRWMLRRRFAQPPPRG